LASHLPSWLRHHASGKGSTYTKITRPTTLVWFETHATRQAAAAREKQIKSWSRKKKDGLANGSIDLGPNAKRLRVSLSPGFLFFA
jgi:predicted GIY-YIG superfamily endonuclease